MTKETAADAIVEQGASAKEAGIDADQCPYAEGDNRDKWLEGHKAAKTPKA